LPNRSPNRPDSNKNPPKVNKYALTTHANAACENPRSVWIDGNATFTMLESNTIIKSPRHNTYNASHRRFTSSICNLLLVLNSSRHRRVSPCQY
jgi:hypothetical protein